MSGRDDGRELLRWHRMEALWEAARALPPVERRAFLDREAGDDAALHDELTQLLARAAEAERLFERLGPVLGRGAEDAIDRASLEDVKAGLAGRYDVERELGRGGSACVFLGTDLSCGGQVAIKVLHAEIAAAIGTRRFLREIGVAAGLAHPRILPLLDSGEIPASARRPARMWYTTPFVAAGSLRLRLESQAPCTFDETMGIAGDVAEALDHAHARGFIHRDIKPENVLLEGGRALLADFGIARALGAGDQGRLTGTGFTPGTPPYMSPEQASAARDLDGRSDLFSLACVVHEMIAGKPPARVLAPSGVRIEVSALVGDALLPVLERALACDPTVRQRSCGELVGALSAAAAASPR